MGNSPRGVEDEKDYRAVDYRAMKKADRQARFERTRYFNGPLGKRRKTTCECLNEVSRSTLSGLSFLIQLLRVT